MNNQINKTLEAGFFDDGLQFDDVTLGIKKSIHGVIESGYNGSKKIPLYDSTYGKGIIVLKPDGLGVVGQTNLILADLGIEVIDRNEISFNEKIIYSLYPQVSGSDWEGNMLDYMLNKKGFSLHVQGVNIFQNLFYIKKGIRNYFLGEKGTRSIDSKMKNLIHSTINQFEYDKDVKLFF